MPNLEGSEGFKVTDIELLTKEENPRTKCWRVEVPYTFKDLMECDELYPVGWKHRKFFGARRNRESAGNDKKTRKDDTVVEDIIRHQELNSALHGTFSPRIVYNHIKRIKI